MLKPELYKKTVDILYDAYFKDTLIHGDCACCAVGNMVASNSGFKIVKREHESDGWVGKNMYYDGKHYQAPAWNRVFCTFTFPSNKGQEINEDKYFGVCKTQIDATGYTWRELARIEYAFETADKANSSEDYMFNGLVKVLQVLKEIHQVTDEDAEVNTTRFRTHYKKKLVKDGYRF